MPHVTYNPGDLVDVRSSLAPWRPGVVATVDTKKIVVSLDPPYPTADEWSGEARRYGGSEPVESVTVWMASEAIAEGAAQHIRPRV